MTIEPTPAASPTPEAPALPPARVPLLPPLLALPGFFLTWLLAIGVVVGGGALIVMSLRGAGAPNSLQVRIDLLKGAAIFGVAVGFMAWAVWAATRGHDGAYIVYIALAMIPAVVAGFTEGGWWWALAGGLAVIYGMGLPSYVKWSALKEKERKSRRRMLPSRARRAKKARSGAPDSGDSSP